MRLLVILILSFKIILEFFRSDNKIYDINKFSSLLKKNLIIPKLKFYIILKLTTFSPSNFYIF